MNELRILSWNIRGVNNSIAIKNLKDLVNSSRADIICIQETKISYWVNKQVNKYLDSSIFDFTQQPSVGLSGGLLTFWKISSVKCIALALSLIHI